MCRRDTKFGTLVLISGFVHQAEDRRMSWSGLEVVGLLFVFYVLWRLTVVIWNLLYTCFIGHAFGQALNVRKLGSWAGKFPSLHHLIM